MRFLRVMVVIALCVLGLSVLLNAGQNKFGVADTREVNFANPVRVGDVLLPRGDYQVQHTMEGANHVMVFKQLHSKEPVEARVNCQLVPLKAKADKTQQIYVLNAANERVLQGLIFRGDSAQHVF
jgi:hypothetical protein